MAEQIQTQRMLSIVIPTFNRPDQLASCLQSFNRQSLDRGKWEVIVIDDGSKNPAEKGIERLNLNFVWRCYRQDNAGPATARNLGADLATGRYLVFIDDDCEADEKFLSILANVVKPATLTGGLVINKLGQNLFAKASQSLLECLYATLRGTPMMFFTTNNFTIERQAFLECGGFSTTFRTAAGEDREFSIRYAHQHNNILYYCPEAIVYHSHYLTMKTFCRQHFNYGMAAHTFRVAMRKQHIKLVRIPLFYSRLIAYPLFAGERSHFFHRLILVQLHCLSQLVYASGFLCQYVHDVSRTVR